MKNNTKTNTERSVVRSETQCSAVLTFLLRSGFAAILKIQDSRSWIQDLCCAMNDLLISQMQNMLSVDKCWLHSYGDCQVSLDVDLGCWRIFISREHGRLAQFLNCQEYTVVSIVAQGQRFRSKQPNTYTDAFLDLPRSWFLYVALECTVSSVRKAPPNRVST